MQRSPVRRVGGFIVNLTLVSNFIHIICLTCDGIGRDTKRDWCRVEFGPLEKGMANHFSILALRTP